MKNKKGQLGIIWSIVLILTGLLILLSSLDVISIKENIYFYVAIAVMGVVFHILCFVGKPKKYSLLVPGGMLIVYAALFIACEYSNTFDIQDLWPVIILAASFGLLELRVFSKGEQGSWLSVIVTAVIGFYFLLQINPYLGVSFGTILILIGVLVVFRISKKLPDAQAEKNPVDSIDLDAEAKKIKPVKKQAVEQVEPTVYEDEVKPIEIKEQEDN